MSIGNTKTQGNKGNNFPYQLAALQLAGISKCQNLIEKQLNDTSASDLATAISDELAKTPNSFLISKSIIYNGTTYDAFLTIATL